MDGTDPFYSGDTSATDGTGDALSSVDMNSIAATAANIANVTASVADSINSVQASVQQVKQGPAPVMYVAPHPAVSALSSMSTAEKLMIVIAIGALALGAVHASKA